MPTFTIETVNTMISIEYLLKNSIFKKTNKFHSLNLHQTKLYLGNLNHMNSGNDRIEINQFSEIGKKLFDLVLSII